jgi:hypothetical protein
MTNRPSALLPVLALAAVLVSGCGDDDNGDAGDAETVFVTETPSAPSTDVPTDVTTDVITETDGAPSDVVSDDPWAEYAGRECLTVPPAGSVTPAAEPTAYHNATAGFAIELSDGTTNCLTFSVDGGEVGAWEPGELGVEVGDEDQGFTLTLSDYSDDGVDDIAAGAGDPFVGLQYQGSYWADSFHTACTVQLVDLTATSSAGTFVCDEVEGFAGGPWGGTASDVTVARATGYWSITTD